MTVYFDGLHLATDGPIEELHEFAQGMGLQREWFQNKPLHPHYDVWGRRVGVIVPHGGLLVSSKELVLKCYTKKFKQLELDFAEGLDKYADMNETYSDGKPCPHPGCASHISHPCELCGRIAAKGEAVVSMKRIVEFKANALD